MLDQLLFLAGGLFDTAATVADVAAATAAVTATAVVAAVTSVGVSITTAVSIRPHAPAVHAITPCTETRLH